MIDNFPEKSKGEIKDIGAVHEIGRKLKPDLDKLVKLFI